jgi:hypothetical protein
LPHSIVFITPIAFTNIGYRTWIIFAVTNLAIIPLVYWFYPETAFRSLEEVDVIFFLADEAPGNPWLNAVRISLHEPLWFGKKGENRLGFDYANSSWHRKLMETTSSGTGSGSGGSHEKRGRKQKHRSPTHSGQRNLGSSGSDTVAQDITEKRSRSDSESPVDPMMGAHHSPTNTLTTTITSHKNDSKRSLRQVLARSRSSEHRFTLAEQEREQQRVLDMQAVRHNKSSPAFVEAGDAAIGRLSPEADPTWWTSDLAPAPLRISRPNSMAEPELQPDHDDAAVVPNVRRHRSRSRPTTADSSGRASYASFSYLGG